MWFTGGMSTFKDLFSAQAGAYARHRLNYPPALFEFIASLAPGHDAAWDCATGNGQAAHGLRAHFARVFATDASSEQIAHALPGDGIDYRVATAESSGLGDASVDAVTVATAFHWFDQQAFAREVRRVARPGAVVAVWTYGWSETSAEVDAVLRGAIGPELEPFWADEVRLAWRGYADAHFPFEPVATPEFEVRRSFTADDFVAYARTWSAVQSCRAATQTDPFETHGDALRAAWGDTSREVIWPLSVRVGRV